MSEWESAWATSCPSYSNGEVFEMAD